MDNELLTKMRQDFEQAYNRNKGIARTVNDYVYTILCRTLPRAAAVYIQLLHGLDECIDEDE